MTCRNVEKKDSEKSHFVSWTFLMVGTDKTDFCM